MKKLHAMLAAASLAFAATGAFAMDASGTVKAIDTTAMTITLEDDTVYTLPADFDATSIMVGDKVMVTYDAADGKNTATAVMKE